MTSLLRPAYSLTMGSQQWTEQLLALDLTLEAAPLVDVLAARLPAAAPISAGPGDPVSLTLDNGETAAEVFTGQVASLRRELDGIVVRALDAGGLLSQVRPAVTFQNLSVGTLIGNLCAEAGQETGGIEDGPTLTFYAADPSRTAWEHVARAAAWGGALARVSADNRVTTSVINAAQPELALRYGRELLSFEQEDHADRIASFVVAGEAGAGSVESPDAFRPTTDFFTGDRPEGPSPASRWRWEPALRTVSSAATAGAALQHSHRARLKRGHFAAFLLPQLRPGAVFEIQDLPEGLDGGPHWLYRVRHRLGPAGSRTEARFAKGGDSFDPLVLLGSLLGAAGGLL